MKNNTLSIPFFLLLAFILWDCKHTNQQQKQESVLTAKEEGVYIDKGKQIAIKTFTALSQQLQKAINVGGIPNAITYCNLASYSITDSLSQVHQAVIRRTSLKNRNPKNKPTKLERLVLEDYAEKFTKEQPLKPVIKRLDEQQIAFYAPIIVNDFCLNCHGKMGETMTKENYAFIKEYYPEDKAIGYLGGELRGIWSIHLNK